MTLRPPFEGDTLIEDRMLNLIEAHKVDTVIETGTETGATANWFAAHVDTVFTCDLEDLRDRHLLKNVRFHLEPSFKMIDNLLPQLAVNHKLLFYLDAHVAPQYTALPRELEVIAHQSLPDCVIVIHDFLVPGHPELGYDTYEKHGPLKLSLVEPWLKRIYPNGYCVDYNRLAQGAKRGICIVEAE